MKQSLMFFTAAMFLATVAVHESLAVRDPRLSSVEISATASSSPSRIDLTWRADPNATSHRIRRKTRDASTWGSETTVSGGATSYSDTSVTPGTAYEYEIFKTTSQPYSGYGYIYAGAALPPMEKRGKVLVLVDNNHAAALEPDLQQFRLNLTGDGWTPVQRNVDRSTSVSQVKNLIVSEYNSDPTNLKALFLFGRIAVPYSGEFAADGHTQHIGAWPADVYYGDINGTWTDSSVNNTNAERRANRNIPNDGKFDQSELPSDVDLQVGRVDFDSMTAFFNKTPPRDERFLLKQYLQKNHAYRHGQLNVAKRGVVADHVRDDQGIPVAINGWRNFSTFFGQNQVSEIVPSTFRQVLSSETYLWSYAAAGGGYYSSEPIGDSNIFATNDIGAVFTMFVGSYFGDWDSESNFLRAPLGSTSYTLTAAYAGLPHWFFHHMALGETIGFSTRLTQNNRNTYSPAIQGTRQVHIALMGDPTLRMFPVKPTGSLNASVASGSVNLSWGASSDENLLGYQVYRAPGATDNFQKISGTAPVTSTSFTHQPGTGTFTYMVQAVKNEVSGSGSFNNLSQGKFATANVTTVNPPPRKPRILSYSLQNGKFVMWVDGEPGRAFSVQASTDPRTWQTVGGGTFSTGPVSTEQPIQGPWRFFRILAVQ